MLSSVKINTGTSWTFFGLFDGFNGWDNKDQIGPQLISAVLDALANLVSAHEPPSAEHVEIGMTPLPDHPTSPDEPYTDAVNRTIKETFLAVDNEVVHQNLNIIFSSPSKAAAMRPLDLALSGTSALLSFFDLDTRLLKIALAGNSRAVLGRRAERKNGDQRDRKSTRLNSSHSS